MAIPFEKIKPDFDQIRDFILGDLKYIVDQKRGLNYAAATVAMFGCEVLAKLHLGYKKGSPRLVFARELIRNRLPEPIATTIYEATRNGLAHGYETKTIQIGKYQVILGISWRNYPHLKLNQDAENRRWTFYIHVPSLYDDLAQAFTRFEQYLQDNAEARDHFSDQWKEGRINDVRQSDQRAWNAWRKFLGIPD
jgi:hypothetical protein